MKVFRVTGKIYKPNLATDFVRELVADKAEHAEERVYAEIGSRHRVKRCHMKVTKVEEVTPEEIANPILKKMVTEVQ
jgi:large subunit ribosomal protein LX